MRVRISAVAVAAVLLVGGVAQAQSPTPYIDYASATVTYHEGTSTISVSITGYIETTGNEFHFPLDHRFSSWVQPAGASSGTSGLIFEAQVGNAIPFQASFTAPAARGDWIFYVGVQYMDWETLDEGYSLWRIDYNVWYD